MIIIRSWKILNISKTIAIIDGELEIISYDEIQRFKNGQCYWHLTI